MLCWCPQVTLTLQKLAVLASPPHVVEARRGSGGNDGLVRLVSGERCDAPHPALRDVPHGVLYLTLDASQESAQAKVSSKRRSADISCKGKATVATEVVK